MNLCRLYANCNEYLLKFSGVSPLSEHRCVIFIASEGSDLCALLCVGRFSYGSTYVIGSKNMVRNPK